MASLQRQRGGVLHDSLVKICCRGRKLIRRNAERSFGLCEELQDLDRALNNCDSVVETYDMITQVENRLTERYNSSDLRLHLAFNHRRKLFYFLFINVYLTNIGMWPMVCSEGNALQFY